MPLPTVGSFLLVLVTLAGTAAAQSTSSSTSQTEPPGIAGIWVLNPALTQRPEEIGFSPDWARGGSGGDEGSRSGGGRGRGGGSGSSGGFDPSRVSRESIDDSTRVQQLTGEARTPASRLTIVQKPGSVSIADDQGHSRTFHPDGKQEALTIGTVALPTTARWDAGSLVVVYDVERGRQLRYTYAPATNPSRLLVEIRFLERGREGDTVKLTYEPPGARERALVSGAPASAPTPAPAAAAGGAPAAASAATPATPPPVLPPGSELRGISTIGTVVEELTTQGASCGLDREKIRTSIAKILADAGFKTDRFGNEETYVYANIVTSKLADGTCVSRYDASLLTQADATFPYLKGLVAVQVPLLHEGGMAGGSPSVHAAAVMETLAKYVNGFVTQIRAANK